MPDRARTEAARRRHGGCGLRDGRLTGSALEIAAGVADAAEPGEMLAASTVYELLAGSGFEFSERETVAAPLAAGACEWRLFSLCG